MVWSLSATIVRYVLSSGAYIYKMKISDMALDRQLGKWLNNGWLGKEYCLFVMLEFQGRLWRAVARFRYYDCTITSIPSYI